MAAGVAAEREWVLDRIFGRRKVAIGVVHCVPFPGAPRYRGAATAEIVEAALADAGAYAKGGIDGLIIENHGDIPFLRPRDIGPETAAMMAVITERVRDGDRPAAGYQRSCQRRDHGTGGGQGVAGPRSFA